MDSDLWAARLAAAKRQFNLQNNHHLSHGHRNSNLDRFNMDDIEVEEEVRPDYPCPYCYEEFDIASLCSHLEDDHSCESKATTCSICSVKVVSDMLSHITLQHGHLFKLQRRRRLRRVPIPNGQAALSLLGRDLREAHLQVLLGVGGSTNTGSYHPSNTHDHLLSSLALNLSASETDDLSKSLLSSLEESSSKSVARRSRFSSNF